MGGLSVLTVLAVVGCIAILPRLFYIFQVARRRKVENRVRFKRTAISLVLYGLSCAVLLNLGYTAWETLAFSFLLGLTPGVFVKAPKRSRIISARVRREVIARDLRGSRLTRELTTCIMCGRLSWGETIRSRTSGW